LETLEGEQLAAGRHDPPGAEDAARARRRDDDADRPAVLVVEDVAGMSD
jgi:hypothetical protein